MARRIDGTDEFMRKVQTRNAANHARTRLSVVPEPPGWAVHVCGSRSGRRVYKTQREAVAAARKLIENQDGGEIIVHGRDGRIRAVDTFALGGGAFDRINAVEGIVLTAEMTRDFQLLDRKRLSPEARRRWLIAKYGSRSDDLRRRK